jgi:hypothetical protein
MPSEVSSARRQPPVEGSAPPLQPAADDLESRPSTTCLKLALESLRAGELPGEVRGPRRRTRARGREVDHEAPFASLGGRPVQKAGTTYLDLIKVRQGVPGKREERPTISIRQVRLGCKEPGGRGRTGR